MKATYILILLCLIGFFGLLPFTNYDAIINEYGFSSAILDKPWIFVTSIFLHGSLDHILANILVLLFVGLAVEKELGKAKMLTIFFIGAFLGDVFSLFYYPPDIISIGASAGIFALVGVGMIIKPLNLSLYPFIIPVPLALLGALYIIYNIIGFFTGEGNTSYIAHFGGLAVGLLAGIKIRGFRHTIGIIIASVIILAVISVALSLL
jgi:membrane associated rhomboid family serine protease